MDTEVEIGPAPISSPAARTIIRVGNPGKDLREARERLGLIQEQVAERSGVLAALGPCPVLHSV
jgi:hypothetical protein